MFVLDKGYVNIVDCMGSDLSVVNAARVSFAKESTELSLSDKNLIGYLVKNKHDSVLRHSAMTFEIYAPLMVARQWWKHTVASTHIDDQEGWNETSRRYVTENNEYYIPEIVFMAPEHKKQGAGNAADVYTNNLFISSLEHHYRECEREYDNMLELGIAPEQARLFLPAYGLYIRWRWTASLNAVLNFLSLRLDGHAQSEMREYANAVRELVKDKFPVTMEAFLAYRCL